MRTLSMVASAAIVAVTVMWAAVPEAGTSVSVPLSCNKGPDGQVCRVNVTIPASIEENGTFTVRIDGNNSGKISHTGLKYIYNMTTEFRIPDNASYVAGSAKVIPETGSANVRPGARVTQSGRSISLVLPGHVEDGQDYTPPSFEFQLKATGSAGSKIVQKFNEYRLTANAIIIGDVHTVCNPNPKPYSIGTTNITAAAPAP
jgi:hypothetical protein